VSRPLVLAGAVVWLGATLVLARLPWFRRERLRTRLLPYAPPAVAQARRASDTPASLAALVEAVAPAARALGARLAGALGVDEELALRLERVHATDDPTAFRTRQLGWSLVGLAIGAAVAAVVRPPAPVVLLALVGGPLLGFLVLEHRLAAASTRWQRRLFLELPVVCEQLGMLLSAGYSLGGALDRVARRGRGACARDLASVGSRIRHGVSDLDALREWAARAQVPAVHRLVAVLCLHRDATDLGALTSSEAHAARREVQRELIESIERRSQQVWIPVTVATLLPGALFLAIPFTRAMQLFGGG
jgi:tight adherence protein C